GPDRPWAMAVQAARPHHGRMLVQLEGVTRVEEAQLLRHYVLAVPDDELVELEEGEYWHWQLVGLEVVTPDGSPLGRLSEVVTIPAHDLYVVQTPGGEVLIPAVDEYVLEVDLAARRMLVKVPEIPA
ncbi:MAG: ribosome maturation factor RimM, partial [Candidatus Eremiobacterota bacterium]